MEEGTPVTTKLQRNQTLECCRILAAVFVVFLHVPFPGTVGKTVNCLARLAVPLFFAISGWFSYGAEGRKLLRRMGRILLLTQQHPTVPEGCSAERLPGSALCPPAFTLCI